MGCPRMSAGHQRADQRRNDAEKDSKCPCKDAHHREHAAGLCWRQRTQPMEGEPFQGAEEKEDQGKARGRNK